jgi:hypothetical protein
VSDDNLEPIRAQYWIAMEARMTMEREMAALNLLINRAKAERGMRPEDELPLWPKAPPTT